MNETMTVRDAAKTLGISTKTVRRYVKSGLLAATREPIGFLGAFTLKIDKQSIEQLMKGQNDGSDS